MGNPSKLWIPAEKLDENVKRMAWLLFLECWKQCENSGDSMTEKGVASDYTRCLEAAKIVRQMEQPKPQEAVDFTPD